MEQLSDTEPVIITEVDSDWDEDESSDGFSLERLRSSLNTHGGSPRFEDYVFLGGGSASGRWDRLQMRYPHYKTLPKVSYDMGNNKVRSCMCGHRGITNLCYIQRKGMPNSPVIVVGTKCISHFKKDMKCMGCDAPHKQGKLQDVFCSKCTREEKICRECSSIHTEPKLSRQIWAPMVSSSQEESILSCSQCIIYQPCIKCLLSKRLICRTCKKAGTYGEHDQCHECLLVEHPVDVHCSTCMCPYRYMKFDPLPPCPTCDVYKKIGSQFMTHGKYGGDKYGCDENDKLAGMTISEIAKHDPGYASFILTKHIHNRRFAPYIYHCLYDLRLDRIRKGLVPNPKPLPLDKTCLVGMAGCGWDEIVSFCWERGITWPSNPWLALVPQPSNEHTTISPLI